MRRKRSIVPFLIVLALTKTSAAHAQRLDDIVDIITFAWQHGDAKALIAMSARDGIAIETPNGRSGPMGARQAIAVLRRVFVERETVSLKGGMTQIVGGSPKRAFTAMSWTVRAPDTTQAERYTIYLELVSEGERWYITQIRILP